MKKDGVKRKKKVDASRGLNPSHGRSTVRLDATLEV